MNSSQTLRIGTMIPGTAYKIKTVLGQGNFGITYLVYDEALEIDVAMKEFFPQDIADRDSSKSHSLTIALSKADMYESQKRKFISEARSLNACRHHGVVEVRTVLMPQGTNTTAYIMEYIKGETLRHKFEKKPLKFTEAIQIINKIAEPLIYLHTQKRIAHFDLNPNNIMVRDDGSVVLIDFGFAKQYDPNTNQQQSYTPVTGGTLGYIAPEQEGGLITKFSPAPDIYALGGVLYFLLTGHSPKRYQEYLQNGDLLFEELPLELHGFFRKAMATKITDRFESVEDFVNNLNRIKINKKLPYLNSIVDDYDNHTWLIYVLCLMSKIEIKPVSNKDRTELSRDNNLSIDEMLFGTKELLIFVNLNCNIDWNNTLFNRIIEQIPADISINRDALESARIHYNSKWKLVEKGGMYNYKNKKDNYISDNWFEYAVEFSRGWAIVYTQGGINFINGCGQFLCKESLPENLFFSWWLLCFATDLEKREQSKNKTDE